MTWTSYAGKWVEDPTNTTPYLDVLQAQGVSWAMRQVIKLLKVSYTITDNESTLDSVDIQGTVEHIDLNWEWVARTHPVFGPYKDRVKRNNDGNLVIETVSEQRGWAITGVWTLEDDGETHTRRYEFKSKSLNKSLNLVYKRQA
ncbi:hypothetical protein SeMB42_g05435 [Synchytrium endobioticum]|uniref:Lipocalin-like domain-containing protein n=1 Tax=Synchytrium endobioticum TaxID=286115 RepID=A0A507CYW8_9FUNG|nr:hypothetical protein SeMB42_g05435 [Synchytrium endobioticum]TPX44346.1 hypothetical protein SeLEV6574_g04549 [Synchytrium endobioticum]